MSQKSRIQARVDSAANWSTSTLVLLDKEIGYERETGRYKIGDGKKVWNELEFAEFGEGSINPEELAAIMEALDNKADKNEVALNVKDGLAEASLQNSISDAGSKVFRFDLEHEYTDEDRSNKRYYLTYVVDEMKDKQFTLVLTSNYDFYGTITNVIHTEGDAGYITVDNYVTPNTNDSTDIWEGSYILLPYDYVDNTDPYTWNNQFINEGSHMLGNDIEGEGGVAFGEDNHAMAIGSFATGYQQIAAGKYAATFGRYNTAAYCDFVAGQNMKVLGHWDAGFGRDNYIANTSDYSIAAGLRNEIYKSNCSAFGRGHVLQMDDASARGRYSENDTAYRYIDRVGYGDGQKPDGTIDRKNIYTLDKEGNAWFKGNIKFGGTNYDNANEMFIVKEYSTLNEMLSTPALLGTVAQVPYMVASYPTSNNADYNLSLYPIQGDSQYELGTFYNKQAIKIGTKYAYFNVEELSAVPSNDYELKITYFDDSSNTRIRIFYLTETGEAYVDIYRTNTQQWKTSTVQLKGMKFKATSKYQSINDFRITTVGQDAYISNIELYNGKNLYVLNSTEPNAYTNIDNWTKINENPSEKTLYLTDFFKKLPEGKTIDDLISENDLGCYIYYDRISSDNTYFIAPALLLVGTHKDTTAGSDGYTVCQTKICCETLNIPAKKIIQTRQYNPYGGWNEWSVVYDIPTTIATLQELINYKTDIGNTVIYPNVVYNCRLGENSNNLDELRVYQTTEKAPDAYGFNAVIGGKPCRKSGYMKEDIENEVESTRYKKMMYFNLPYFTDQQDEVTKRDVEIKITYYDIGNENNNATINIEHSMLNGNIYTSAKTTNGIKLNNTKTWKQGIITIKDMVFTKSFNYGNDFRIYCDAQVPLYISDVSIHIKESDLIPEKQYSTKEIYMLTNNDYTELENWVKINK